MTTPAEKTYGTIHIRELKTRESVKSFPAKYPAYSSNHERAVKGMLRNMDTDRFYVDDSEVKS